MLERVDELARRSDGVASRAGHDWVGHELLSRVSDGEPSSQVVVPVERDVGRGEIEALSLVRLLDVIERGPDGGVESAEGS